MADWGRLFHQPVNQPVDPGKKPGLALEPQS
jgi:hypothetical protein